MEPAPPGHPFPVHRRLPLPRPVRLRRPRQGLLRLRAWLLPVLRRPVLRRPARLLPLPAPVPAAGTTAAPAQTASVENPYGLDALWKGGDIIARAVLIILAIMSLGTWYIMITKYIEQARLFGAARAASRGSGTSPLCRTVPPP